MIKRGFFHKYTFLLLLIVFTSGSVLAQNNWYVNPSTGNNFPNSGSELEPFATIEKALSVASAGDSIKAAGGFYNEVEIDLDVNLTIEAVEYGGDTTIYMVNGFDLNADVVFKGGVFKAKYVTLTTGELSTDGSDLLMPNGSELEIIGGTITFEPVYEVSSIIRYSLTDDYTAGPELPSASDDFELILNDGGGNHSLSINSQFSCSDITIIGGTLQLGANAVFTQDVDNNDIIEIGDNTLTLAPTANTDVILGRIVSSSGLGTFTLGGDKNITADPGSELPDFIVPEDYTGTFSFEDDILVTGDFIINSGIVPSVISTGSDIFEVEGDFIRNNSTPGNFNLYTSNALIIFSGDSDSEITPGENLEFYDFELDKDSASLSLLGSFDVNNDLTVTAGDLDLIDSNLKIIGNGVAVENNGKIFSSTKTGYISLENLGGAIPVAVISGSGVYGDINFNPENAASKLYTGSAAIDFSGILIIEKGEFEVQAGDTLRFTDELVDHPTIKINTAAANSALFDKTATGALSYQTDVSLWYYGSGDYAAGDEMAEAYENIFNLDIDVSAGKTVTGFAGVKTMSGSLNVASGAVFDLDSWTLTMEGDEKAHLIEGSIINGELSITGSSVVLDGALNSTEESKIDDLTIASPDTSTVTSSNLQYIENIEMLSGIALISMNESDAELGNDITINGGELTFDQGAGAISNILTVNDGTFILGDDLDVLLNVIHQNNSSIIDLNGNDLTIYDDYIHANDASFAPVTEGNLFASGSGKVVFNGLSGSSTLKLLSPVTIPGLEIDAPGETVTLLISDLTVSHAFVFTDGEFDLGGKDLFITGNQFDFNVKTPAIFNASAGNSTLHLMGDGLVITPIDLGNPAFDNDPDFSTAANQLNVTIESDGAVTFGTDGVDDYTFTFDGLFSQVKGDVIIEDNILILNGGFDRTIGSWWQGTADEDGNGFLQFNFNGTFSSGDEWYIDNLNVNPGNGNTLVNADNVPYVINKVLWLWSGTLNQNSTGNLTLGHNGSIWRRDGTISAPMTFGERANLMYKNPTSSYNIGQEWPALPLTLMQSVAFETPGQTITLTGDRQINTSLGLYDGTLDIDDNTLTLVEGANLELKESGIIDLSDADAELTANDYHLVYLEGDITTNLQGEFPDQESNILSVYILEDAYVTLDADKQITGPLWINVNEGSGLDFDDHTLSVTGDVTVNRDCFFNSGAAAGRLSLNGTSVQNINVPAEGLTFPVTGNDAALQINNTSAEGVNLVGGNLTMDNTSRNHLSVVDFVQGTFNTGENQLVLWHTDDGIEPVQGFTRNVGVDGYSHVVGNVRKFIDATGFNTPNYAGIALARIDFPVGSSTETAVYYRPLTVKFSTLPSTGFFLTISHTNSAPEGIEGLPVDATDSEANPIKLSNYHPFYWTVSPTVTVQQIVSFDLEFSIEGFEDYLSDGIDNVRIIKRDDGDINEEWELADAGEYDNSVINDVPVILLRNAIEALESPGQQFAVGIKSKMSAGTISDVTVETPDTWTYDLSNLNITGNVGQLVYSVTSSNPLVATASISNGMLNVTFVADGWTKITVRAVDVDGDLIAVSFTFTYDTSTDITDITELPQQFSLAQNYPNPFNPSTTIRFGLSNASDVVIKVYNVLGQEVAALLNQPMNAGYHEVEFNASGLASGLYIYRIEAGEFVSNKKMILLK